MVFYNPYRNAYGASLTGMAAYGASNLGQRYARSGATRSLLMTKKKTKRSGRSSFASKVIAISPAYHSTIDGTAVTFLQNDVKSYNLTAQVSQGTSNNQRSGDFIQLLSVKIAGLYVSNSVAGAYTFRVMLVTTTDRVNNATLGSGISSTDIFLPNTASNICNGITNPKTCTVYYDEQFDCNSQVAGASDVVSVKSTVALNQKFLYDGAGSVYGKVKNLYLVVMTNVSGGTVGVTAAGSMAISTDLIFKHV